MVISASQSQHVSRCRRWDSASRGGTGVQWLENFTHRDRQSGRYTARGEGHAGFVSGREEQRQELLLLARGPRRTGWWRAYGDVPSVPTYVDYEMAAAGIDSCQALVIPGLLQTREYARR